MSERVFKVMKKTLEKTVVQAEVLKQENPEEGEYADGYIRGLKFAIRMLDMAIDEDDAPPSAQPAVRAIN